MNALVPNCYVTFTCSSLDGTSWGGPHSTTWGPPELASYK